MPFTLSLKLECNITTRATAICQYQKEKEIMQKLSLFVHIETVSKFLFILVYFVYSEEKCVQNVYMQYDGKCVQK